MHQSRAQDMKISHPNHVEKLARHLFQNTKHMKIVERYFPTNKTIEPEIKPPPPRNFLIHPGTHPMNL